MQVSKEHIVRIKQELRDAGETQLPPVTTFHDGAYMVIRVTPLVVHFTDYRQRAQKDVAGHATP